MNRTILKYYVFSATNSYGYVLPILVLYLLLHDLSFTQIATLGVIQATLTIVLEIPTGYLGDRFSRRSSMMAAKLFSALAVIVCIFADSFVTFALAYACWALMHAFSSGSVSAWLYDTLEDELDTDEFTRVNGRGRAINRWSSAGAMILGSLLYVVEPIYPFVPAAVASLIGAGVLLTMPRNPQYTDESEDETIPVLEALPIVRRALVRPPLRSFVLYVALFLAIHTAANDYVQPITVNLLESRLQSISIFSTLVPPEATLGFLYASFTSVSAFASYYADDIGKRLSVPTTILVIPVVSAIVLIPAVFVPILAVPMFFVLESSTSLLMPIVNQFLNDNIESVGRATVLSAASMIYAVVRAPVTLLAGSIADAWTPLVAVALVGCLFLVGSTVLFVVESPISSTLQSYRPASD